MKSMRPYFALSLAVAAMLAIAADAPAADASAARLYSHPAGDAFFAVGLEPSEGELNAAPAPSRVVVLFDTSASQTGPYRSTALAALESLLASLDAGQQVELMAADLTARPMTDGPVAAHGAEIERAMTRLNEVTPLGTTDMEAALTAAADRIAEAGAPGVVVYVGDGMSPANLLGADRFSRLIERLQGARASVTSYAIGPERDNALLAALANQTGGNLYVDSPMVWASQAEGLSESRATEENLRRGQSVGRTLADWSAVPVVWSGRLEADASVAEFYPASAPLRGDRSTVVIGRLANANAEAVSFVANGSRTTAPLGQHDEANAYLAELVEKSRRDQGLALTTLGDTGLEETGRMINAHTDGLAELAQRAVSLGDRQSAARISQAVLRRDPGNPRARTVQRLVSRPPSDAPPTQQSTGAPQSIGAREPVRVAQLEVLGPAPAVRQEAELSLIAPQRAAESGEAYPPAEQVVDGRFLDAVDRNQRVFAQMLEKEVQNAIVDARDSLASDPQGAIQSLKLTLENVKRAPELVASVRAGLIDKLTSALREASRAASIKEDLDRERQEALAAARERRMLLDRLALDRERETQLVERFNALIDERRFAEANEVGVILEEIDPHGVMPAVAQAWGQHKRYYELNRELRTARAAAFIEALHQVETSHIPFPSDPPIVYPDSEVWKELTRKREKYKAVDLGAQSGAEEQIATALSNPLTSAGLEFTDTPLEEVVAFLRDEYDIEIQLDNQALDDLGIGPDEPVDVQLRNTSLRSALRFMLQQLELTYVIADEMMLITTEEEAENRLSVKVYPVADLVLPIITPQVSGIGGGGGGGGLGGGGGGGGLGGGGGGQGGGGFGGGGGGGQFSVADTQAAPAAELSLTRTAATPATAAAETQATDESAAQPTETPTTEIGVPADADPALFWEAQFQDGAPADAAIRNASRRLMRDKQYDHVIALVQTSLRHGAPQPWMYEALSIAMRLDGRPEAEIERAVMSAVDFSKSSDELIVIAQFLSGMGLEKRAAQVCEQAVKIDPLCHEAYALGLRAAQRSDDLDALRWAATGVLSHAWPEEQKAIETAARRLAEAALERLEREGRTAEHEAFAAELVEARRRDCVVTVSWTGEADVDIAVQEPGGTLCTAAEPRTSGGGVNLGDSADPEAKGLKSETYACPRGFEGEYRVAIRKVWGDLTADRVTVEITVNQGAENEQTQRKQIQVADDKDAVVVFNVEEGSRDEAIEEQMLAGAIRRQQEVGRAVLSQQLSSLAESSGVAALRPDDRRRRRAALAAGGGSVGFQPVIITLPEGTNLQVTGVVSADRRYVRVTPVPFFSGISEVTAFTFAGGGNQNGNQQGGNGNNNNGGVGAGAGIGNNAGGQNQNNAGGQNANNQF
ncbi:hypothetical protein Mal64_18960 [Pseudobythopirellula maris]|uniref:VWFA domain-containing protein n=1 Tax=Pseudobythopirellula maris TaxID=2527991 RepID=A0A5C5ZMX4_9BACT|nr:hypothetical protein [Pseudobythopirellula maris]TWT88415.1 hypothetical protein Mal64_18960 [Pseudobythopirellula maris]